MGVPWETPTPNTSSPVSVCVSKWTSPTGPCTAATAFTPASVIEWSPPSTSGIAPARTTSPTSASIAACVRAGGVGGDHGRVAVVDDAQHLAPAHLRLEVRAGRAARRADRTRAEPGPGAVRDEIVRRSADDRRVDPGQVGRILGVGQRREGEQARVVRLVR